MKSFSSNFLASKAWTARESEYRGIGKTNKAFDQQSTVPLLAYLFAKLFFLNALSQDQKALSSGKKKTRFSLFVNEKGSFGEDRFGQIKASLVRSLFAPIFQMVTRSRWRLLPHLPFMKRRSSKDFFSLL
jgi:hypothetical protein